MSAARRILSTPAEEFLSWLSVEKGRSPNTLSAYRRDIAAYEDFLLGRGAHTCLEASAPMVVDYVRFLQASGHARSSVARAMTVVRTLHRFCLNEGYSGVDPTGDATFPGPSAGLPKALDESDVLDLIESVGGDSPIERRDRAILETLYGGGLRISEIAGLNLGDLDRNASLLRVFGKGSKERVVPLGRCALAAMERWIGPQGRGQLEPDRWARKGDAEAVFLNARGGRIGRQGIWLAVRARARAAGLEGRLTPHVLRHSCATHMLDHGADIRVVQELLGHASISTTQVYTRVSAARLRAVYDAAHPRARGHMPSGALPS